MTATIAEEIDATAPEPTAAHLYEKLRTAELSISVKFDIEKLSKATRSLNFSQRSLMKTGYKGVPEWSAAHATHTYIGREIGTDDGKGVAASCSENPYPERTNGADESLTPYKDMISHI